MTPFEQFQKEQAQAKALNELCDRMFGPGPRRLPHSQTISWPKDGEDSPPIDIRPPNYHHTKTAFREEKAAVENIIQNSLEIVELMEGHEGWLGDKDRPSPLEGAISVHGMLKSREARPKDMQDMVRLNYLSVGLFEASRIMLAELADAYTARLKDLQQQEQDFWSDAHRPPNHYAREIALRFAKLYAREREEKPTIGVSNQSGGPSTDFGRGLEQVFSILEIDANWRNPGEWAISKLTEADWAPLTPMANMMRGNQNALDGLLNYSPKG